MTDLEKIEFLLNLLKREKFEMRLDEMSSLVQSYRYLIDRLQEEKKKNGNNKR